MAKPMDDDMQGAWDKLFPLTDETRVLTELYIQDGNRFPRDIVNKVIHGAAELILNRKFDYNTIVDYVSGLPAYDALKKALPLYLSSEGSKHLDHVRRITRSILGRVQRHFIDDKLLSLLDMEDINPIDIAALYVPNPPAHLISVVSNSPLSGELLEELNGMRGLSDRARELYDELDFQIREYLMVIDVRGRSFDDEEEEILQSAVGGGMHGGSLGCGCNKKRKKKMSFWPF